MPVNDFRNNNSNNSSGNSGNNSGSNQPPSNGGMNISLMFSGNPPMTGGTDDERPEQLVDMNERCKDADPALFRDLLVDQLIAALISKNKPNGLLVGSAGVGKSKIVEELARRLANNDDSIPTPIQGYTIYEISVGDFTAGMIYRGQAEQLMKDIINYISNPENKAILFVDEIHALFDQNSSRDIDSGVQSLKGPLARGDFRMIGATTSQEVRAIDDDPAVARRFQKIIVDELTVEQTETVVQLAVPSLVTHYSNDVTVADDLIEKVVRIASTELPASYHRPDNALTLLDRTMAMASMSRSKMIKSLNQGTTSTPSQTAVLPPIPVGEGMLKNMAQRISSGFAASPVFDEDAVREFAKSEVIGQDDVIENVMDIIRRQKLKLFPQKKPLSFIFAGPSGVGKTSLAHIIAQEITGQKALVINMAEYSDSISVSKLIGAADGYLGSDSKKELPLDPLTSNPHRVILLDEFEKSYKDVQTLFLSALDSGEMKSSRGTDYDFSKAIVIVTTNAGREMTERKNLGFGATTGQALTKDSLINALSQHFPKEMLGRFEDIYAFSPLSSDTYREIVIAKYHKERTRILEENPYVKLPDTLDDDQIEALVKTQVAGLGARPAERAVQKLIEDIAVI